MTASSEDIVDLIYTFNEQVIGLQNVDINPLTHKQHRWIQDFCQEELRELDEAFKSQDVVGMVDAVADLIYGAMGTFKKMGLSRAQVREVFTAVHTANMSKKRGDKGRGSDEDAVKPATFVSPEAVIAGILMSAPTEDSEKEEL